jgi:rfaE bifunctional protein kinase chain/domain
MSGRKDAARLAGIVDRFPRTQVLVVGDLMIDHYVWGDVSRISPEAPVPVVRVTRENLLLGGAANVAQNIHALGGRVAVCGVVGHDDAGKQLQHMLRRQGMPTDGLVTDPRRPTTIKTRVIAHHQQVVRFDRETKEGIGKDVHGLIFDHVRERMTNGLDAVVLSDYCKGVVTKDLVRDIVRLARKHDVVVSVDPKVNHFGIYSGVTVLTPNTKEASTGAQVEIEDDESLLRAGKRLLQRLSCRAVLITRGEHGMSLFEKSGRVTHIPTEAREVFDVTGAGDTVISTLTLALAAGAKLVDAARLSNVAAGIVVGVVGTTVVTPEQLKERMARAGGGA